MNRSRKNVRGRRGDPAAGSGSVHLQRSLWLRGGESDSPNPGGEAMLPVRSKGGRLGNTGLCLSRLQKYVLELE